MGYFVDCSRPTRVPTDKQRPLTTSQTTIWRSVTKIHHPFLIPVSVIPRARYIDSTSIFVRPEFSQARLPLTTRGLKYLPYRRTDRKFDVTISQMLTKISVDCFEDHTRTCVCVYIYLHYSESSSYGCPSCPCIFEPLSIKRQYYQLLGILDWTTL